MNRERHTAMDAEQIQSERAYEEARRLYRGHRWFRMFMGGLLGLFGVVIARSFGPVDVDSTTYFIRFVLILMVGGFLIEWLGAVLFKRKSRPWRWQTDPADDKPQRWNY